MSITYGIEVEFQTLYRLIRDGNYGVVAECGDTRLEILEQSDDFLEYPEDEERIPPPFILRANKEPWWLIVKRVDNTVVDTVYVARNDFHVYPSRFFEFWEKGYKIVVETQESK